MSATLTFILAVAILYVATVAIVVGEVRKARRFDTHADAAIDLTGGAR